MTSRYFLPLPTADLGQRVYRETLPSIGGISVCRYFVQAEEGPVPERRACDTCSYPCYIARVLLNHKGLSCCFSCALKQPKYLEGAECLCHPQYPEFHYTAHLLQGGGPPPPLPGATAEPGSDQVVGVPLIKQNFMSSFACCPASQL